MLDPTHTIAGRVRDVIASVVSLPASRLTDDIPLWDLGDSLDLAEVDMALEEEFALEIQDEELERWKTVGDVVKYIEGRVSNG